MSAPQGYAPIPASDPSPPSASSRSPSRRTVAFLVLASFAASLFAYVTFVHNKPYYRNHPVPINHQSPIKASPPMCPCPRIYKPVCCFGPDGPKTEPNKCECDCYHGHAFPGRCPWDHHQHGPDHDHHHPPSPPPPPHCICPSIYAPVCCKTHYGKVMTKGNECECTCDGGKVLADHPCPHDSGGYRAQILDRWTKDCICTFEYNPTCCHTKHGKVTAGNPCMCKCHGTVLHPGPCY